MKKKIFVIMSLLALVLISCNNYQYYRIKILEDNSVSILRTSESTFIGGKRRYRAGDSLWVKPVTNELYSIDTGQYSMRAIIINPKEGEDGSYSNN